MVATGFHKRFKIMRTYLGLSQTSIAELFQVSQKTVSNWERGRNEPFLHVLARFHNNYAININWLVTGDGEMLLGKKSPLSDFGDNMDGRYKVYTKNMLPFKEEWTREELGLNPDNLFLYVIKDKTMNKTFQIGDMVLIDSSKSNPEVNGMYLIKHGKEETVRYLQLMPNNSVNIKGENPESDTFKISLSGHDDFKCIGKVVYYGRQTF